MLKAIEIDGAGAASRSPFFGSSRRRATRGWIMSENREDPEGRRACEAKFRGSAIRIIVGARSRSTVRPCSWSRNAQQDDSLEKRKEAGMEVVINTVNPRAPWRKRCFLMRRQIQIQLHVACIRRHLCRWLVCICCLTPGHAAGELRAVWFDLNGIVRAAFLPSSARGSGERSQNPRSAVNTDET
jgi:hypothetical protein